MIISAGSIYDSLVKKWKVPMEDIQDRLQQQRGYQIEGDLIDYMLEINLENIRKEEEKDYLNVSLDKLKEGMVLTSSVRMKSRVWRKSSTGIWCYNRREEKKPASGNYPQARVFKKIIQTIKTYSRSWVQRFRVQRLQVLNTNVNPSGNS